MASPSHPHPHPSPPVSIGQRRYRRGSQTRLLDASFWLAVVLLLLRLPVHMCVLELSCKPRVLYVACCFLLATSWMAEAQYCTIYLSLPCQPRTRRFRVCRRAWSAPGLTLGGGLVGQLGSSRGFHWGVSGSLWAIQGPLFLFVHVPCLLAFRFFLLLCI